MKVMIALVFERDPTSWAQKRQISQTEALADFAGEVRTAAQDGTIADALGRSWPAMRGHISAHPVDGLDDSTRDELLRLLQRSRGAAQDAALIAEIRQHLAEHWQDMDGRDPRWVVFGTVEWDNGYFLAGTGATVHFEDGDHMPYTFEGSRVDDLLTAANGARGRTAALGVDLRDATLEFSDYGENVLDALDIPTSEHREGDGCAIYLPDYIVVRDGVEVSITDIRDGDVFTDWDGQPWRASRVGRDDEDVHIDIQPATSADAPPR